MFFNKFLIFLINCAVLINGEILIKRDVECYEPTWESLDSRTLPRWYDKAKVGIFIHWGVYSVPSYGTEWFWTNWRTLKNDGYVEFMQKNYRPGFTYQEFANDFTGELFNATEWTELFEKSGAKYVVLTSKHHDGYALWPSKYSFGWNSVDVGPHRDIIAELSTAIRKSNKLRFGLYHSLFEWYNPMYLNDKVENLKQNEFVVKKIFPEMIELVNTYLPEVIWSDGEWEAPSEYWNSTHFLAWLYNESPVKETVVTNDRWGSETLCKHGGFHTCSDRYNPGVLQMHKWENAMTLDRKSWGHRQNAKLEDYLTSKELIDDLVITVSCGGNILVNVGPTKAGTIEPIFMERLNDMGSWLNINGEAIYHTYPWKYQNDTHTPDVWYTYSSKRNGGYIYAILLNFPTNDENTIDLHDVVGLFCNATRVKLLGYKENNDLAWSLEHKFVQIQLPSKAKVDSYGLNWAWTLRIQV